MASSPPTEGSASPTADRPTPRQLATDPDALLLDAYVRRRGSRLSVAVVWGCNQSSGDCPRTYAVARSDDDFATVSYLASRSGRARDVLGPARPFGGARSCADVAAGGLVCIRDLTPQGTTVAWARGDGAGWGRRTFTGGPRLLPRPVTSLRRDTYAVVWGGDGATLFPFERVSRSTDGGARWSTEDVARPDGVMPYSSGSVVDPAGRLLTLLDHWSDDRGRPSSRPHGLYVSEGQDWSRYVPLGATFRPAPAKARRGWSAVVSLQGSAAPDPVIWVTTWDRRLYVSPDGGRSFRRLNIR